MMDKKQAHKAFEAARVRHTAWLNRALDNAVRNQQLIDDALLRGAEFGYTVRLNDDGVWPDPPETENVYDLEDLGDLPY